MDKTVKRLYPDGKKRAFVLSYDDGVEQDVRLVGLLDKYGLRGTFNLNSGLMKSGFVWTHECGADIKRLPLYDAPAVYGGHEVASHSYSHPYLHALSYAEVYGELRRDKELLEDVFCREVRGFALPFLTYSDTVRRCAVECGFSYSRISDESKSFAPDGDGYAFRAGLFHLSPELNGFVDAFSKTDEELALCMLIGHSYDLDVYGLWGRFDELFARVAALDAASMTVIELIDYLGAMRAAKITQSGITNSGKIELWFDTPRGVLSVKPGQTITL